MYISINPQPRTVIRFVGSNTSILSSRSRAVTLAWGHMVWKFTRSFLGGGKAQFHHRLRMSIYSDADTRNTHPGCVPPLTDPPSHFGNDLMYRLAFSLVMKPNSSSDGDPMTFMCRSVVKSNNGKLKRFLHGKIHLCDEIQLVHVIFPWE